jgi:bromodomain adjacent to zinc finger domain protein 1A
MEPSQALLDTAASKVDKQVYYLPQTGEIFETYEYAPRSLRPFLT